ncbi:MAG TPA: hypothetical protein VEU08_11285 [Vicinamibacterales bacterium]|nr:hypothetical protein [Vicinamibacterales bacterium]
MAAPRLFALALAAAASAAFAQLTERPLVRALTDPAIEYASRPTTDAVADLARRVEAGSVQLPFEDGTGYLRPVLDALNIPVESQMLVMSKTGVQGLHTGPESPRAIYFDDAVTVGYIRGAPLLEFAVQDPRQGVILYTIDQKPQARPQIDRPSSCLRCHVAYNTLHVPGFIVRSQPIAPDGLPLGQFGTYDADDRTPFAKRWGGWYVSGAPDSLHHLGNAIAGKDAPPAFDPHGYLSTSSDIAALMVFEHQSHMTNLITRIGWESRLGALQPDSVREFVDYLLFVDEQPLPAAIVGASAFARRFEAQGPPDGRGRSLRQLDLHRRLLRYPCSYMIYSAAFRALPDAAREAIYARMWTILSGADPAPKYRALEDADRRAVVEVLKDTVPDLPRAFTAS